MYKEFSIRLIADSWKTMETIPEEVDGIKVLKENFFFF